MPSRDILRFKASMRDYERWLATEIDQVWEDDLREKHRKMRDSPFVFLRATYWRWAETILRICDDLASAPVVIGVGDIHLENYGVWRDEEGRLVWGVNSPRTPARSRSRIIPSCCSIPSAESELEGC